MSKVTAVNGKTKNQTSAMSPSYDAGVHNTTEARRDATRYVIGWKAEPKAVGGVTYRSRLTPQVTTDRPQLQWKRANRHDYHQNSRLILILKKELYWESDGLHFPLFICLIMMNLLTASDRFRIGPFKKLYRVDHPSLRFVLPFVCFLHFGFSFRIFPSLRRWEKSLSPLVSFDFIEPHVLG